MGIRGRRCRASQITDMHYMLHVTSGVGKAIFREVEVERHTSPFALLESPVTNEREQLTLM